MRKLLAVAALAISMATSAHANLLTNGSFEGANGLDAPAGWSFSRNPASGLDKVLAGDPTTGNWPAGSYKDGTKAAHMSWEGEAEGGRQYWIYQTFTTVPGTTYNVTGWISGGLGGGSGGLFNGNAGWVASWKDGAATSAYADLAAATHTTVHYAGFSNSSSTSFDWKPVSFQLTPSTTQTTLFLWTFANLDDVDAGDGTIHYWDANFDAFDVSPVPEPVFFQMGALVGMGGLGLLRLRRKSA